MTDHDLANDELYDRICTLVHKCLSEEAEPAEIEDLERLVCEDAQARKIYVALMHETRSLRRWATSGTKPVTDAAASASHAANHGDEPARPLKKTAAGLGSLARDFAREPLALAILVLVMISAGVLFWNLSRMGPQQQTASGEPTVAARQYPPPVGPAHPEREGQEAGTAAQPSSPPRSPDAVVARLTGTRSATWGETAWTEKREIRAGQRLSLKQGLAEIAFESGATVIVEGPAEIEIGSRKSEVGLVPSPTSDLRLPTSANACSLTLGKLVAHVPQRAHGFTVATPTITIVDRGTQFGVEVRAKGGGQKVEGTTSSLQPLATNTTQVQVFQGLVEIESRWAQAPAQPVASIKLQAGEGVTSQQGQPPRKIAGDATGFVRELPANQPLVPLATWPKDSPLKPGDIVAVASTTKRFYLFKIDPGTGEQKLLATGFPYRQAPNDHGLSWTSVAVEPDGNVLVGAQGLGAWDDGLLRIDPRSGQIKVLTRGGLLKGGKIAGLAVAADGNIYAAYDSSGHGALDSVLKIDPATAKVTPLARFGVEVTGVCFDAGGHDLLVSSSSDATVGLVPLTPEPRVASWSYDRSLGRFDCVAVNRDGRVFVGTTQAKPYEGTAQILEVGRTSAQQPMNTAQQPVKTAQQPVKTFAILPKNRRTWSPMTIACEADGDLLVGSGGVLQQVYRVDTTSGKVTVLSAGGLIQDSTFLAVVPGTPAAAGASAP